MPNNTRTALDAAQALADYYEAKAKPRTRPDTLKALWLIYLRMVEKEMADKAREKAIVERFEGLFSGPAKGEVSEHVKQQLGEYIKKNPLGKK